MTRFSLSFVYFRSKYCFIKIMASLIYILSLLIVSSKIVVSYHVQCNYDEHTKVLSIVGLKSSEDFENYGIKCGDYNARTLEYVKCYLGKIKLPLKKVKVNYPTLRDLYWRCEGFP